MTRRRVTHIEIATTGTQVTSVVLILAAFTIAAGLLLAKIALRIA